MQEKWLSDNDHFSVLSHIIRVTTTGGVLLEDEISEHHGIYDEAAAEGLASKDEIFTCPQCDTQHSLKFLREYCDCGFEFPDKDNIEPDVVQYYDKSYPAEFSSKVKDTDKFKFRFSKNKLDEFSASNLHPLTSSTVWNIHISPYYHSETGFYPFPGHSDVFLSWESVPQLLLKTDDALDEIGNRFSKLVNENDDFPWPGNGNLSFDCGLGAPSPDSVRDDPWFTMLRDTTSGIANERSQSEFEMQYHKLFEKLGIEFLHMLFPHAMKFQAGKEGSPEPDGYLHTLREEAKQTYLVESKAYSADFKIFEEEDKNSRYIHNFKKEIEPDSDYNLRGVIFLASKFDKVPHDVHSYIYRNIEIDSLDIICINDRMMGKAVTELRDLYRRNPAATYRLYDETGWYYDLLDGLARMTETRGPNLDWFENEFLELVHDVADQETKREANLRKGFEDTRTRGFESLRQRFASSD
ncbi:hypothetical protein [Haloarchaeobius sp. DT45]|uniref:hypothetical protein n=1 Tax=Haloarchaeobius sp. DT45 TaxID=3446116 RepID=UPI003F6ABEEE